MRLFTGISIEPATLRNLDGLLAQLRPLAPLKWSPPENLHITTKFIGAWPETRLAELERALAGIAPAGPMAIKISGLGYFRSAFYAGVAPDPALLQLAEATDCALAAVGCARETRPYFPHLTLARIRNENIQLNMRELREKAINMANTGFGSFEATEFHLYLSKPTPAGSVYSILRTYDAC